MMSASVGSTSRCARSSSDTTDEPAPCVHAPSDVVVPGRALEAHEGADGMPTEASTARRTLVPAPMPRCCEAAGANVPPREPCRCEEPAPAVFASALASNLASSRASGLVLFELVPGRAPPSEDGTAEEASPRSPSADAIDGGAAGGVGIGSGARSAEPRGGCGAGCGASADNLMGACGEVGKPRSNATAASKGSASLGCTGNSPPPSVRRGRGERSLELEGLGAGVAEETEDGGASGPASGVCRPLAVADLRA